MKKVLIISLLMLLIGCEDKDFMNTPIEGKDFNTFFEKINSVCKRTDEKICSYVKGSIILLLPNAKDVEYRPSDIELSDAHEMYKRLNGKTPMELIDIYKGLLLKDIENIRKRDIEITINLDNMKLAYEYTKHYSDKIIIDNKTVSFTESIGQIEMKLGFTFRNNTPFFINQLVGEVEFYSPSDILLGKSKAFVHSFNPLLRPGRYSIVKVDIDGISQNDLALIRIAKGLKIKLDISSFNTNSANERERIIILNLPSSYYRMRELLTTSEQLYYDTIKKINEINGKLEVVK